MKLAPKFRIGFLAVGLGFLDLGGRVRTPAPLRVISVEVGVTPSCPYGLAA